MNIAVIIPYLSKNGGTRAILHILKKIITKKKSKIIIYFCVIPPDLYTKKNNFKRIFKIGFYLLKHFLIKKIFIDEYKISNNKFIIRYIYNFSLKKNFWNLQNFKDLKKSEILISTSFESSFVQDYLCQTKKFSKKSFYFVQHIETWPIYNNEKNWLKAYKISKIKKIKLDHAIHKISLKNSYELNFRKMVNETYKKNYRSIITTSSYLKNCLKELSSTKVKRLTSIGNDTNIFGKRINLKQNNTNKKKLNIFFIFRSIPWKGDNENYWILKKLDKKFSNLNFIIMSNNKIILPKLNNNFEIHINIDDSELNLLYWKADIAIFNSYIEGFGSMPLEAMCCKTACVTTDVGAIRDYAENNKTCFIVNPRDKNKMLKNIIKLIKNKKLINKFKYNSYRSAKKINWEKSSNIFLKNINS